MANEEAIDHYFQVVADAQAEALKLKSFHARITLLALMDALSRAANPVGMRNSDRFTTLIDQYTQWELSSSYSLRQLSFILDESSATSLTPAIDGLRAEIARRMQRFPMPGTLVYAMDVDPSTSDLQPFLTAEITRCIERVRYPRLLWALRNSVVHELRNPGKGTDFKLGEPSPYYHIVIEDSGERTWELYIPNVLITTILTEAASNLKQHLTQIDRNPWDSFPYNPKWY